MSWLGDSSFSFCFFFVVEESCWIILLNQSSINLSCRRSSFFRRCSGQCWRFHWWCSLVAARSLFKQLTARISVRWERVTLTWRRSPFVVVLFSWRVFKSVRMSRWSSRDVSLLARDLVRPWMELPFHSTSAKTFNIIKVRIPLNVFGWQHSVQLDKIQILQE